MKACIFLGPSLALADARQALDAIYLPPARQGDLYRALHDHEPDHIGLIDGFFEQVPAVWHKEILWALARGVRVYGAASMGALRAAELHQFGMIGVGRIFEAYRDGRFAPFADERFEDDDEVAVAHGPRELGYVGSVAMVDIRATLALAADQGIIGAPCRDQMAGLAKALFYKDRSYGAMIEAARAMQDLAEEVEHFSTWVEQAKISQKEQDARALLALLSEGGGPAGVPSFRFEHTAAWELAAQGMAGD